MYDVSKRAANIYDEIITSKSRRPLRVIGVPLFPINKPVPLLDFKREGQPRSIFSREEKKKKKKEKTSADVNTHQKTSTKVLVTSVSHKRSKERRDVRLGSLLSSKGWMHVNDIYENQQGFVFSLSFCRRFSLSGRDLMRQEATNFLFRFGDKCNFLLIFRFKRNFWCDRSDEFFCLSQGRMYILSSRILYIAREDQKVDFEEK